MITILKQHLPNNWSSNSRVSYSETCCTTSSNKYKCLKEVISNEFVIQVNRITEVESPYLRGLFLLKKAEYEVRNRNVIVKELYHDTAASKIPSILSNNLDWRLVNRHKFGCGVSFSPSPEYANKYSSRANGADRAMIVADVLVGTTEVGCPSTCIPDGNTDTTTGNSSNVYVKFYDNEFYPKYVIYYKSTQYMYTYRF